MYTEKLDTTEGIDSLMIKLHKQKKLLSSRASGTEAYKKALISDIKDLKELERTFITYMISRCVGLKEFKREIKEGLTIGVTFLDFVIGVSCAVFGTTRESMESSSNKTPDYHARYLVWEVMRNHKKGYYSLAALGGFFNRDHATVINGLRKYEMAYLRGDDFKDKCDEANNLIQMFENKKP